MNKIKKARIGTVVPVYKTVNKPQNAVDYFAKLTDFGRAKDSFLLESADIVAKYGEFSIGTNNPCLKIEGSGEDFEIKALNKLGEKFISFLKGDFDFCDTVSYGRKSIQGKFKPSTKTVSEDERLKLKTHMDILRGVAFKFSPTKKPFVPYCGLFGAISYDFIDQFENLPKNKKDILKNKDYVFYFADNLFLIDHKKGKMQLIANALIMDGDSKSTIKRCSRVIKQYETAIKKTVPKERRFKKEKQKISTDTTKKEYESIVKQMKQHIIAGDIFQVVPSRTIITGFNSEPLTIYRKLRELNPSPYMFYFNFGDGILAGASPEMSLRVQGGKEKIVEIRPIAGTKPRGIVDGKIDNDLDSRYETELKIDEKELAEHTMLVDLARNDVARVSKPGTRIVNEPFVVEKYSHVQHLVSNVSGTLNDNLDALHAYLASMNMGTLTGAPKIEAMKLIRKMEKTKRGFYGGAVGYITPHKDFDSTIVIRSMYLKDKKAYVRAGAGIVYDSVPENEFDETEKKAMACLKAIELAGESR